MKFKTKVYCACGTAFFVGSCLLLRGISDLMDWLDQMEMIEYAYQSLEAERAQRKRDEEFALLPSIQDWEDPQDGPSIGPMEHDSPPEKVDEPSSPKF